MARDIVVLAGTAPHSVLALCKMAKRHNAHTYVVCVDDGFEYYSRSRLVSEAFMVSRKDEKSFWERFFASHTFDGKPILYPTTDAACLLIDNDRAFYEALFEVCMPTHEIISAYNDKTVAENEAAKYGLNVPKTCVVRSATDFEDVIGHLKLPVIVKPQGAIYLTKVGFKFRIIEKFEDLEDLGVILSQGCQLVIQEYIPGDDDKYSFYLFYRAKDGTIHDCMGVKTLQRTGIMAVGTVKQDDYLTHICRDYLQNIDYYGIGGIEFKRYNGKYYFIEMSTRTEGFLAIAQMAGTSLVEASYLDITGSSKEVVGAKENTVYVDTFFWILRRIQEKQFGLWIKELFRFLLNANAHLAGIYLDWRFSLCRYWKILTHKN